jgi:hypothetical protein
MRLATGVLFGLGVVWFAVPRIAASVQAASDAETADRRRTAAREALRERLEPVCNSSIPGSRPLGAGPHDGGK